MAKTKVRYPDWICDDCGMRYGNWYQPGVVHPANHYATYHIGECECCHAKEIPVTEPRDYGHLIDGWESLTLK